MLVQVYGDNAMKKTAVYKWVKCFSGGRESVTDEERSGRPATNRTEENIVKICPIVCENHQLFVKSIAEQVNIDRETVRKILTEDLDMRCVQKWSQRSSLKNKSKEESRFAKTFWRGKMTFWAVITGDETWVYEYDLETKRQSAQFKCQFPMTKKILLVQIKSQNNVADFF